MDYLIYSVITALLVFFINQYHLNKITNLIEKYSENANHQIKANSHDCHQILNARFDSHTSEMSKLFAKEHNERLAKFLEAIFSYIPPEDPEWDLRQVIKYLYTVAKERFINGRHN